jgi:hypothetical protein
VFRRAWGRVLGYLGDSLQIALWANVFTGKQEWFDLFPRVRLTISKDVEEVGGRQKRESKHLAFDQS